MTQTVRENTAVPVLRVRDLSVRFRRRGGPVRAVTAASFDVQAGECVALVGESGCGKSVLTSALLGLLPGGAEVSGHAWLQDTGTADDTGTDDDNDSADPVTHEIDVLAADERVLRTRVRGRLAGLVPQSPATHLTPVRTVRSQLAETLRELRRDTTVETAAQRARFPADHLDHYPHELSGGLAQRAATALALAGEPRLLLADEPTTGLDRPLVTETMRELRQLAGRGHTVVVVTHDLAAAAQVADRVAVMYAGRIVEVAPSDRFFRGPDHPYSRALLDALPDRGFTPIPGQSPELTRLPAGCAFRPRCPTAGSLCGDVPNLETVAENHQVACWYPVHTMHALPQEVDRAAS